MYQIYLNKLPQDDEKIKKFIAECLPHNLEKLEINYNAHNLMEIDYYHDSLCKGLSTTTTNSLCRLRNFKMDGEQFKKLVISMKHSKGCISFGESEIRTDAAIDFGSELDDATFTTFQLHNCGSNKYSDWATNKERLPNIFKALGKVETVRKNLKELYMHSNKVTKEEVQTLCDEVGLTEVQSIVM